MTHQLCPNCAHSVSFEHVFVIQDGVHILDDINASIPRGECTAIVGPNGAGKTTMVLVLLNEVSYRGNVCFHGYAGSRPRVGYVPQSLSFDRGMPLTVLEFMAAFHQKMPLCFGIGKKLREKLIFLLEKTACAHLAERQLGALSGGELQRVMLSAALSQDPELLILDEPASGMDFKGGEVCCELLDKFRREQNFTQLMITHDLSTVAAHASHVICLNKRIVAEGSPRDILKQEVLTATFGPHHGRPDFDKLNKRCHDHDCGCKGGH